MRFFRLTTLLYLALFGSCYAAAPLDVKIVPKTTSGLQASKLYEIDIKCEPTAKPLPTDWASFDSSVNNAIVHIGATASHYLIISNSLPAVDSANPGQITMPASAIRILPVFSMKYNHVVDYRAACTGSTFIMGGQPIYLVPTASWSTQVTAGPILAFINGLAQAISPIWSIFAPIPAAITAKVTNVAPAETAIGTALSTLNKDENYAEAQPMGVGTYVVTTDFSKITVTVTQLNALLRSKSPTIRTDFTNQLNSGAKLTSSSDCAPIAGQLAENGFDQTLDIPFALAWLAGKSFALKNDVIQCLGQSYALNAARISNTLLWNYITPGLVVTEKDAMAAFPNPTQPPYAQIDGILSNFVLGLSRIGLSADPPPDALVQQLVPGMTSKVVLNDKTVASIFGFVTAPLTPQNLATALMQKGYRKFGCNGPMPAGENPAGASAAFLAFKVPASATSATENDALLLEPIFENNLISTLYVYAATAQIDAVAKAPNYNYLCGDLKVAH
jgi:hypothetical protein